MHRKAQGSSPSLDAQCVTPGSMTRTSPGRTRKHNKPSLRSPARPQPDRSPLSANAKEAYSLQAPSRPSLPTAYPFSPNGPGKFGPSVVPPSRRAARRTRRSVRRRPLHPRGKCRSQAHRALGRRRLACGRRGTGLPVTALEWDGTALYAAESNRLTTSDIPSQVSRISGGQWTVLGATASAPLCNGTIRALVAKGSELWAAGEFQGVGHFNAKGVAVWNGSVWRGTGGRRGPLERERMGGAGAGVVGQRRL